MFRILLLLTLKALFVFPVKDTTKKTDFDIDAERFEAEVQNVRQFISTHPRYNKKTAFLIDMRVNSGKNRFYVYDLENSKITDYGLVAHGSGSETGIIGNLKFGNKPNSKMTSLGIYAIGQKYRGGFGEAYKLYGLDSLNSNAYIRNVVLHYYSAVPLEEQNYPISDSHGCPMVNEFFFHRIEKIIDASKSKILLKIYY